MNRMDMVRELDAIRRLQLAELDQVIAAIEATYTFELSRTVRCNAFIKACTELAKYGMPIEIYGLKQRIEAWLVGVFSYADRYRQTRREEKKHMSKPAIDLGLAQSLMKAAGFSSSYFRIKHGISSYSCQGSDDLLHVIAKAATGTA